MKILWAHSHFDSGGGPKTVLAWALGLRELGYDIHFIGHGGRLLDAVISNGFDFKPLYGDRFRPSFVYAINFLHYAKKIKPDVLVGVGNVTSMELALTAFLLRIPILLVFNVSPRKSFWLADPNWKFPRISDMVVVNQQFKKLCVKKFGWNETQIHYIPERLLITENDSLNEETNFNRLCLVRRMDEIKSLSVFKLLKSMESFLRENYETTLDIYGDGSQQLVVQDLCKNLNNKLNRQAVNFFGYVDGIETKLDNYGLVIGTEKVAIESVLSLRATAVLRNDGNLIPVRMSNIDYLSSDNFIGDACLTDLPMGVESLLKNIQAIEIDELFKMREWVKSHYDYKIGSTKIANLLNSIGLPTKFIEYMIQLIKMYLSTIAKLIKSKG
jgi:hypothetical protein